MAHRPSRRSNADHLLKPACRRTGFVFSRQDRPPEAFQPREQEFHARQKQPQEDLASFGEDLKHLVNKAFPDIEESSREHMAIDRFLLQLEDPQVAFSVSQKRPSNMDEAVTYTLEMQAHPSLSFCGPSSAVPSALPAAGVSRNSDPRLGDMLQQLMQRMEKLETSLSTEQPQRRRMPQEPRGDTDRCFRQRRNGPCHRCGEVGHIAPNCPAPQPRP